MICFPCLEIRDGDDGDRCAECGGLLERAGPDELRRFVDDRVRVRIRTHLDEWQQHGLIGAPMARKLEKWVIRHDGPLPGERDQADPKPIVSAPPEPVPAPAFLAAVAVALPIEPPPLPKKRARAAEHAVLSEHAAEAGGRLFGVGGAGVAAASGSLEALAALDEKEESGPSLGERVWPVLYENIGWFIGALLVLAGSVYGVREAWLALGDVARHGVIAGALLAYHAGFVGLAAVMAKRAEGAGRVLAAIGAGLLPMVFASLASIVVASPVAGLGLAVVATVLSIGTLRSVGRRFETASLQALPLAMLPALLAQLAIGQTDPESLLPSILPFAGLGAIAWALRPRPDGKLAMAPIGFAVYAALALEIAAVVGTPGDGTAADLRPFTLGFAALTLRAALLSMLVAVTAGRRELRDAHKSSAPTIEVLALGMLATASIVSGLTVLRSATPLEPLVVLVHAAVAALTAALFGWAGLRHPSARHFTVPAAGLAGTLVAVALDSENSEWWPVGVALVAAWTLVRARNVEERGVERGWATVLALGSLGAAWLTAPGAFDPKWAVAAVGVPVTLAAIYGGGFRHRALHYLAGFAAFNAAAGLTLPGAGVAAPMVLLAASGVTAGLGALVFTWLARRYDTDGTQPFLLPWDDLSLFAIAAAAFVAFTLPPTGASPAESAGTLAALSFLLFLRAFRDRSRVVSFGAALVLGFALPVLLVPPSGPAGGALFAAIALLFVGLASVSSSGEAIEGRRLAGAIPLPFGARGRQLVGDGFGAGSIFFVLLALIYIAGWFRDRVPDDRVFAILAAVLLAGTMLVAFIGPGLELLQARGSVATLAMLGVFVGGAAIANRIDRPLPPDVVGWKLTMFVALLWIAALGLRRVGPWLGGKLGRLWHGSLYHLVPHAGVLVLGLVLAVDAVLISPSSPLRALWVTPPMLVVGAALASMLLARSSRQKLFLEIAILLAFVAAALVAAQRAILGPQLVTPFPTGGWVRTDSAELTDPGALLGWIAAGDTLPALQARALTGVTLLALTLAIAALLIARSAAVRLLFTHVFLDRRDDDTGEASREALARWTALGAGLVLITGWWAPPLLLAIALFVAGILLVRAKARHRGLLTSAAALAVVLHALANAGDVIPGWIGPSTAAVALGILLASTWFAARASDRITAQLLVHAFVAVLLVQALLNALAVGGATDLLAAGPNLVSLAAARLNGRWAESWALPTVLALTATALVAAARQYEPRISKDAATTATVFAALTSLAALCASVAVLSVAEAVARNRWSDIPGLDSFPSAIAKWFLQYSEGRFAVVAATAALGWHVASRRLVESAPGIATGARTGRDLLLLATGFCAVVFTALRSADPAPGRDDHALAAGVISLVLLVIVAAHAAWRERTTRHVYLVQVAAVGLYALVRTELGVTFSPEFDAMSALALGFVLVGVTVVARRLDIPPLAEATRRFAAILPLVAAFLLPTEATGQAALISAASGALWGALAWAGRSRFLGSLGAAAMNVALLVFALSSGLDGAEIYLAPLGIMVLALAQIFASTLPEGSRLALRVIGSLLLYLPSAIQISFQIGNAQDGLYPVLFGVACLVGVGVGMLLQIRAYLALGTGFLALDVIATLLHAGRRDHRIAVLVLSLSGLAVLAVMIVVTLRREQIQRILRRIRGRLAAWE